MATTKIISPKQPSYSIEINTIKRCHTRNLFILRVNNGKCNQFPNEVHAGYSYVVANKREKKTVASSQTNIHDYKHVLS